MIDAKHAIELETVEDLLASKPGNKEIASDYHIPKAPTAEKAAEELEDIKPEEALKDVTTIFARDDKGLLIYDYQIRGFLKEAGDVIRRTITGDAQKPWKGFRGKIDNFVFVFPRKIYLGKDKADGFNERGMLVQTPRGVRTCLARSEFVSAGLKIRFEIGLLAGGPVKWDMVKECLDYGMLKGLGQWRNGGYGRFTWKEIT